MPHAHLSLKQGAEDNKDFNRSTTSSQLGGIHKSRFISIIYKKYILKQNLNFIMKFALQKLIIIVIHPNDIFFTFCLDTFVSKKMPNLLHNSGKKAWLKAMIGYINHKGSQTLQHQGTSAFY